MTHPQGGFYSAEDADSEGHEGLFYTWTPGRDPQHFRQRGVEAVLRVLSGYPEGNFEGRTILHTPMRLEEFAKKRWTLPNLAARSLPLQRQLLMESEREAGSP